MPSINTVSAGPYHFAVVGPDRPYDNDFVVQSAQVTRHNGKDQVACVVQCINSSQEPGRVYAVQYSTSGRLQQCCTLN